MTSEELTTLRKEVKKSMIDLDLDVRKKGALAGLADELSARMKRKILRNTLSMALSGFRETAAYQSILQEMKAMLAEKTGHAG